MLLLIIDIERNSKNDKPINSKTIVNQGAIERRRIKPEQTSAAYTKCRGHGQYGIPHPPFGHL